MGSPKFLCDQMLGSLARWLRFFGFDTLFIKNDIEDSELLKIAEKENRVIITRDKELIIRANKLKLKIIHINSINLDDQLKIVLNNIKIDEDIILSRCSLCNSLLEEIEKENYKDKIPSNIYNNTDEFFFCNSCKKIYWKGSHFDKIIEKIFAIKN
jgi:uncharacterized protein with PIN domain